MKFRKKPVIIEAVQWTGHNHKELDSFVGNNLLWFWKYITPMDTPADILEIKSLEGNHQATIGDWIIKGIKGEFYPIKNDIFTQTYDPVEE